MYKLDLLPLCLFFVLSLVISSPTMATNEEDAIAKMQEQMNAEVISKPFFAEKPEAVDAYIKDAMARGLKPEEYKGRHWKTGYTCHSLLRYSWREYRNCKYYHRYHGRYYY